MEKRINCIIIGCLIALSLSFLYSCTGESKTLTVEPLATDKRIVVDRAEVTKGKLPYGGNMFHIINNRVDQASAFGPPKGQIWAKEGHVLLILWVNLSVNSDKEWVNVVGSAHLGDGHGNKYYKDLWYFRDGFRSPILLDGAVGLRLPKQTRLAFQLKIPLPSDLKLQVDHKEIASIKQSQKK